MRFRISGLITQPSKPTIYCALSRRVATGYVRDQKGRSYPVDLSLFKEGLVGEETEYKGDRRDLVVMQEKRRRYIFI